MKTILFPTDFSQASVQAAAIAAGLARLLSAKIIFIYAVRSFADRDKFIGTAAFENETQAKQALEKLASRFSGGIPFEYLIRTGDITDEIVSAAKETKADMIVMSTSGAGDIPDTLALLNSTTADLISKKICPVLAIPAGANAKLIRKIVMAVDSHPIEATVLAPVKEIALKAKAEVLLLTVLSEEKVTGDDLLANKNNTIEQAFAGIPYSVHAIQSHETIDSIRQFASAQAADMIAVVTRKRGFIDNLFHESMSQKLALHSQIPLLVLTE